MPVVINFQLNGELLQVENFALKTVENNWLILWTLHFLDASPN